MALASVASFVRSFFGPSLASTTHELAATMVVLSVGGAPDMDLGDTSKPGVVRTCRFCFRTNEHENPLVHMRETHPRLQWRRAFGKECNVCPYVQSWDSELRTMSRDDIETKVKSGKEGWNWYMGKVHAYETEKNKVGRGHLRPQDSSGHAGSVVARVSNGQETREFLGYLWPTKIFMKQMDRKPSKKEMTSVVHMGKRVPGVLMDTKVPGCIEVSTKSEAVADHMGELANSATHSAAQMQAVMDAATSRNNLTAVRKNNKDGTPGPTLLKQAPVNSSTPNATEDDEGDEAIMDFVWGKRFAGKLGKKLNLTSECSTADDGGEVEEAEERNPKRHKAASSNAAAIFEGETPQKGTKRTGAPSSGPTKSPKLHRGREINNAEAIVLKGEQFLATLAGDGIMSATAKMVADLSDKVAARLSPDLVMLYSDGISGMADDGMCERGVRALEGLRNLNGILPKLKRLVDCMHATTGDDATAAALRAEVVVVKEANVKINSRLRELLATRAAQEACVAKDWDQLRKLCTWAPAASPDEPGISSFAMDEARDLQKRLIVKVVLDFCRVEDEKGSQSNGYWGRVGRDRPDDPGSPAPSQIA